MQETKYHVKAEKEGNVIEKTFESYDEAMQFVKTYMQQEYSVNIYFADKKDLF